MLKPLSNRVVVKKIEIEDKTKSGILLQSNIPKPNIFAQVMSIGPDVVGLVVGDKIIMREFSGMPVEIEGEQLIILTQNDILAILN